MSASGPAAGAAEGTTAGAAARPSGGTASGPGTTPVPRPADRRTQLSWSDLRGARVGVWGLGREGMANLRKLDSMGVEPLLVDDHPPAPENMTDRSVILLGEAELPVLATGEGGLAALERCEVVVKSPGISRYRPEVSRLESLGIPVAGGLGLWLAGADLTRVVCITGTKGKSTTAAVTGHLLAGLGYRCLVGGNIGQPPYDPAGAGDDYDYWVIEVSSYQATDLACSPPVVAVTSLHPDHLDWHGGVDRYYRDKLSACSQPGADLTIANGDSELLREREGLLGPRVEWVSADDDPAATWMEPLGLLGSHNRRNALIARRCLVALGAVGAGGGEATGKAGGAALLAAATDDAVLEAAAAGFRHLDHRLQAIGTIDGVTFVDDSLSTNVLPTLAALSAFPGRRVALIVGGHDRGIDYAPLAAGLAERDEPTLVLTLPDSGPRITAAIKAATHPTHNGHGLTDVHDCPDMDAAVVAAFSWARSDGIVLLSPAAPSFGHFRDYRDRGDAFARAIRNCTFA